MQIIGWVIEGGAKTIGAYADFKTAYDNAETARNEGRYRADVQAAKALNQVKATQAATLKLSRQANAIQSEQVASYGASGFNIEGSPLDVMANTAREYERDILLTGYGGTVAANESMQQAGWEKYLGEFQESVWKKKAWMGVLQHVSAIGQKLSSMGGATADSAQQGFGGWSSYYGGSGGSGWSGWSGGGGGGA